MRYFILIFLLLLPIIAAEEVKVENFVNDYANIINDTEEEELNTILKNLYDKSIAEYSIVTVNSLKGKAIESYSLELAQGKLGDKEKNNGLLLLISLEDKKYRFEVGRGLEANLNDAKVGRIGRNYLVPNFRNEEYGKGIVEASKAVESVLLENVESEYYVNEQPQVFPTYAKIFLILVIIFIGIIFIYLMRKAEKMKDGSYFDAAGGAVILFGGRGFGGGNSGGFGGFGGGGGSFGGGGASGGGW